MSNFLHQRLHLLPILFVSVNIFIVTLSLWQLSVVYHNPVNDAMAHDDSASIPYQVDDINNPTTFKEIDVTGVIINTPTNQKKFWQKGDTVHLSAIVTPDSATNKYVTWDSSDSTVAKVDAHGIVTILGDTGKCYITATAENGVQDSYVIHLKKPQIEFVPVEKVTLSTSQKTFKKGVTFRVWATIKPDNATDQDLKWEWNKNVVRIKSLGRYARGTKGEYFTIISDSGTCTITAEADNGIKGEFKFDVQKPAVVSVEKVILSTDSDTNRKKFKKGDTFRVKAAITPKNATNQELVWEWNKGALSGKKVNNATYDFTVTGESGACTITAKAGDGVKGGCKIQIANIVARKFAYGDFEGEKTSNGFYKGRVKINKECTVYNGVIAKNGYTIREAYYNRSFELLSGEVYDTDGSFVYTITSINAHWLNE